MSQNVRVPELSSGSAADYAALQQNYRVTGSEIIHRNFRRCSRNFNHSMPERWKFRQ
ncbi:hypothetical protein P0082_03655 [Candidatus Haliotispira prima]|uniref:Uncharacterized protein n=1 Tax=Candidatus Haliotispira prima TaxID=3034016 RepID=A0ABY8MJ15_9SPIO|nr:hypothetical protein P0082_03655 [Candidatus Haliotispira prima]